jgi:hypothetical protein
MEGGRRPLGRENRQNLRRLYLREPPASNDSTLLAAHLFGEVFVV